MRTPTALIADDEPALRNFLRQELAACWPELDIVGEARNGAEALDMIERLRPDIAFLDIRMPTLSGMEVAQRAGPVCHVVFVTAYDEFALQAFDSAAIDYLLKPVSRERLARTADRLKEKLSTLPRDISSLVEQLSRRLQAAPQYLQWLQLSHGDEIFVVAVDEVDLFQSADKYTLAITSGKEWVIRKPLKALEDELDPARFWRVHRNTIVRVAAIDRAAREIGGRLVLHLRGRPQTCPVSRAYVHRFKQL
jgi:DNA-binding LytR/AlgR family response regulator